jgi:Icc-related predicted phosphoesterase
VKNLNLIAISDLYSDIGIVQQLTSIINNYLVKDDTIIVIAGDIGIRPASKHYQRDIKNIIYLLSKICKHIYYLPGDSDNKQLETTLSNAKNLDRQNYVIDDGKIKVGLLGLGGAPTHSLRSTELSPYLWDESLPIVAESLLTELKINIEKVAQANPDYIILVTHSPPYGIADRSKPVTLREMLILEDILEELQEGETKPETKEKPKKKKPTSPRHLGSRIIRDFVKYYKPDIHIFGHVHKEGGKTETHEATRFFNISHLSPLPYRLTGRKFLQMKITEENITTSFDHVITERNVPFDEFIERYL